MQIYILFLKFYRILIFYFHRLLGNTVFGYMSKFFSGDLGDSDAPITRAVDTAPDKTTRISCLPCSSGSQKSKGAKGKATAGLFLLEALGKMSSFALSRVSGLRLAHGHVHSQQWPHPDLAAERSL